MIAPRSNEFENLDQPIADGIQPDIHHGPAGGDHDRDRARRAHSVDLCAGTARVAGLYPGLSQLRMRAVKSTHPSLRNPPGSLRARTIAQMPQLG